MCLYLLGHHVQGAYVGIICLDFIDVYIAKSVSFMRNRISLLKKKTISLLTTTFSRKTKFISKLTNKILP